MTQKWDLLEALQQFWPNSFTEAINKR